MVVPLVDHRRHHILRGGVVVVVVVVAKAKGKQRCVVREGR